MYPRRYCLGLIEAQTRHPHRQLPLRYPRRYCLGLIEAGCARNRHTTAGSKYPRRYCLGLIEAWSGNGGLCGSRIGIRGVIASASLKPPAVTAAWMAAARIRGVIASASLKQRRVAAVHIGLIRIRGVIASASLKLILRPLTGILRPSYPRRYCLGLIEAMARKRRGCNSGKYPRRYCLGLIEAARISKANSTALQAVSEALLPRPH